MNTKHHKIGIGIAALIAGTLTLGPAIGVDAYAHPSPDFNKRPKPGALALPCPAADDIAACDLQRTDVGGSGTSVTSRPSIVAGGGGAATLNPTHVTPSPR